MLPLLVVLGAPILTIVTYRLFRAIPLSKRAALGISLSMTALCIAAVVWPRDDEGIARGHVPALRTMLEPPGTMPTPLQRFAGRHVEVHGIVRFEFDFAPEWWEADDAATDVLSVWFVPNEAAPLLPDPSELATRLGRSPIREFEFLEHDADRGGSWFFAVGRRWIDD